MSMIVAEFDTVAKTLKVTVNGEPVEDVAEVYVSKLYSEREEYGCSLTTVRQNRDDGTAEVTRLVASQSAEGKSLRGSAPDSAEFEGFLRVESASKAQRDIERFFGAE